MIALEGSIEIDEVYGVILDVPLHHVKVVAVVQQVGHLFGREKIAGYALDSKKSGLFSRLPPLPRRDRVRVYP